MPLPTPTEDETEDEFISRCMGDELMNEEYPDNDQRLAICYDQWRSRNKEGNMTVEHKTIQVELKADEKGTFTALIARLNEMDLDGDVTMPGAFPEGKEVLVSAYQHGSWHGGLPVGKAVIHESKEEVLAEGEFNLNTEAGREHYETIKFTQKLQEWSYGFTVLELGSEEDINAWAEQHDGARPMRILKKLEPFEISPVMKGAGRETATLAIKAEKKGAISYQSAHPGGTPKASEDESWDAGKEVREAEVDDLKVMCAYVDSQADPDNKTSYKLPHHKAAGKHTLVWKGVAAAMAALLGARGGVAIPDSAKKGVYNHLAQHYKEFDKEAPDFRNLEEGLTYTGQAEAVLAAVDDLATRTKSLADLRRKEGRVLSTVNRERIKTLLEALSAVAKDLKELLDSTEPVDKAAVERLRSEFNKIEFQIMEVS